MRAQRPDDFVLGNSVHAGYGPTQGPLGKYHQFKASTSFDITLMYLVDNHADGSVETRLSPNEREPPDTQFWSRPSAQNWVMGRRSTSLGTWLHVKWFSTRPRFGNPHLFSVFEAGKAFLGNGIGRIRLQLSGSMADRTCARVWRVRIVGRNSPA